MVKNRLLTRLLTGQTDISNQNIDIHIILFKFYNSLAQSKVIHTISTIKYDLVVMNKNLIKVGLSKIREDFFTNIND